jgi:hypothetical protein
MPKQTLAPKAVANAGADAGVMSNAAPSVAMIAASNICECSIDEWSERSSSKEAEHVTPVPSARCADGSTATSVSDKTRIIVPPLVMQMQVPRRGAAHPCLAARGRRPRQSIGEIPAICSFLTICSLNSRRGRSNSALKPKAISIQNAPRAMNSSRFRRVIAL